MRHRYESIDILNDLDKCTRCGALRRRSKFRPASKGGPLTHQRIEEYSIDNGKTWLDRATPCENLKDTSRTIAL